MSGRWHGVDEADIGAPVLVVAGEGIARTLPATDPPSASAQIPGSWHATFTYSGEPQTISRAQLLVAPGLAVTLPAPSARPRSRFRPRMLEAQPTASGSGEAVLAAWAEVTRLEQVAATAQQAVAHQQSVRKAEAAQLRAQLQEAREAAARLADDLGRDRHEHADRAGELERLTARLAEATRERDEAQARLRREIPALHEEAERLEAARRREAADVERLSATVADLVATKERLVLSQRATLREVAAELEIALERVESIAEDVAAHADAALDAMGADTDPTAAQHLKAIGQDSRSTAGMVERLRRRLRALDPSHGRWGATRR